MSYMTYDSVAFQVESFQRFDQQAVYSEDGADYLYTEFAIVCRFLWNPKAFTNGGNAAQDMDGLRARLMAPRKQLIVSAPASGATGTAGNVFLRSPLLRPSPPAAANSVYFCDAKNGPHPLFCNIQQIIGEDTFIVDYGITTWVNECPGTTTNPINPVLSHRWSMTHTIDEFFHTTRVVAGSAILRTDLVFDATGKPNLKPDDFRDYFFHTVPPNYKRMNVHIEASPDGSRLDYIIQDQEVDSVVDPAINLIAEVADIDGTYSETTTAATGVSAETLSSISNGAASGLVAGGARAAAVLAAIPALKAAPGLFPTKTYEVNIHVVGTRRATRAGLVQVAIRAAAGFRIGTSGIANAVDALTVIRNFVQNFLVDNYIQVGLVRKEVWLRNTFRANGLTSLLLQSSGSVQRALSMSGNATTAFVQGGGIFGGGIAAAGVALARQIAAFRAVSDNPAFSVNPLSAESPTFPEQLPGVTKAFGSDVDSYGPRGGSLAFGAEKGSRGTTIAHLLTAALGFPCTAPAAPIIPAPGQFNSQVSLYNPVRR